MVEVRESISRDLWSISDESDDVETPLQVWQRMFGQFQPIKDFDDKPGLLITSKLVLRRKCRRRIGTRPVETGDSSSEDETLPAKRTRSSKTRRTVKDEARRKKTRKLSAKSTSDATFNISPSVKVADSPESTAQTRLQKRALPIGRVSEKESKKPVQFNEEYIDHASSNVSNDEGDDSQKTILLDTPDLDESYEATTLEKKCEENYPDQPGHSDSHSSDIQQSEATLSLAEIEESDPESKLTPDAADADTKDVYDESTDIDDDKDVSFPITCPSNVDKTLLPHIESTELDEIFFKPLITKKPPPIRSQKKTTSKLPMFASAKNLSYSVIFPHS